MRKYFVVAETADGVEIDFVKAESPDATILDFDMRRKGPMLYSIKVYANPLDYQDNNKPLAEWLSPRAESREHGVICSTCDQKTELLWTNIDGKNTTDRHICPHCQKKILVKFI